MQLILSHKLLTLALPGGVLGLSLAEYETRDLVLNKLKLTLPDWPKELTGFKIAHLSDLHLDTLKLKPETIVKITNSTEPDMIVITGDIINSQGDLNKVMAYLDRLKAKYEKFVVMGNNDYTNFSRTHFKRYVKLLEGMGYNVLINSSKRVNSTAAPFWVIGVDDPATAHDDVDLSFAKVVNDGLPRIALSHSTDCIEDLFHRKVGLMLTGHTHGGQIKLPLLGTPIKNTLLAEEGIIAGYHVIGGINVYINQGIGTSIIPLRIGVKPEVCLITLE